jgi:hypothetical protein
MQMLKKIGVSALGLIAVLAYWTITGHHTTTNTGPTRMPTKFLNGGGGTLTIDADSSSPATLRYTLHGPLVDGSAKDKVEGYEELGAGPHSWTTEIAPNTGVYLEWEARNPQPGARLNWTVKLNGKEIDTQQDTLQGALKANEAFFIQYEREDVTRNEDGE